MRTARPASRLARRLAGKILRRRPYYLPRRVLPDDVYLVSYPRSGNTWTRMLVGNYLERGDCSPERLTYVVPDIHVDPALCDDVPRPRFIKSHVAFVPDYPRVVYIARDGRDVAVSYYFYRLRGRSLEPGTTFSAFLADFNRGAVAFGSWSDHVSSWLDHGTEDSLLLVRYEDLRLDPGRELERILRFSGLDVEASRVEVSVAGSGMERWRASERNMAADHVDTSIRFARSGEAGQFTEHFSPAELAEFAEIHGAALRRLGYLD